MNCKTKNGRTIAAAFLLMLGWQLINPAFASACPTCKFGLHDNTALGYAISIIFMMAMPFIIFSFWTITILRLRAKMNAK